MPAFDRLMLRFAFDAEDALIATRGIPRCTDLLDQEELSATRGSARAVPVASAAMCKPWVSALPHPVRVEVHARCSMNDHDPCSAIIDPDCDTDRPEQAR